VTSRATGHCGWTQIRRMLLAMSVTVLASCSSQENNADQFDYPFGNSTASAYYQAMYDAAMSQTDRGERLVDDLAGGRVVDIDTYSLISARVGSAGAFLGDNYQPGALAKLLRWWDFYGTDQWNPDNSVQLAVGLVDFESRTLATAASRVEANQLSESVEEKTLPDGLLLWGTITDGPLGTRMFWVGNDSPVVMFIACDRYGQFASAAGCDREKMLKLRDEIESRLPTSKESSDRAEQSKLVSSPGNWQPSVSYEFDADQMARSYLDPDGLLRTSWGDAAPPMGRYAYTGRRTSYTYRASSDDGSDPGLELRVAQIPIKSTVPALKLTETICFGPDDSGSKSEYCGNESEIAPDGPILGGRTAVEYGDPKSGIVISVRGHVATSSYFMDFHCGHPLLWDEDGLTAKETDLCREVIATMAKRIGSK